MTRADGLVSDEEPRRYACQKQSEAGVSDPVVGSGGSAAFFLADEREGAAPRELSGLQFYNQRKVREGDHILPYS